MTKVYKLRLYKNGQELSGAYSPVVIHSDDILDVVSDCVGEFLAEYCDDVTHSYPEEIVGANEDYEDDQAGAPVSLDAWEQYMTTNEGLY